MENNNLLDLNALMPEKRIVKIDDQDINVGFVPSRIILKIINNMETIKILEKNPENMTEDNMNMILDLVSDIMKRHDPKYTIDYIYDNLALQQMIQLLFFVLSPFLGFLEKKN